MQKHKGKSGFGLVEVLIGTAIIAAILVGLVSAFILYIRAGLGNTETIQGTYLAEEGIEAVRHMRDNAWSNITALSTGTNYHLAYVSGAWEATTTPQTPLTSFTRTVVLKPVYRDSSTYDIVESGSGTFEDSDARKVTVTVSWGEATSTVASYENGTTDADLAAFPSNDAGDGNPAQGVTPAENMKVDSVALLLKRVGTPSDVYLEIRASSTVGTIVATSDTLDSSTIPADELTWTTFAFSGTPALASSTAYFLRLRSTPPSTESFSGSEGVIHWGYGQASPSPYAGGTAWRYIGRNDNPSDEGQELADYDFSFRITDIPEHGGSVDITTYLTNIHK